MLCFWKCFWGFSEFHCKCGCSSTGIQAWIHRGLHWKNKTSKLHLWKIYYIFSWLKLCNKTWKVLILFQFSVLSNMEGIHLIQQKNSVLMLTSISYKYFLFCLCISVFDGSEFCVWLTCHWKFHNQHSLFQWKPRIKLRHLMKDIAKN